MSSEPYLKMAFDVSLQSFGQMLIRQSSLDVVWLRASHACDWETPHFRKLR